MLEFEILGPLVVRSGQATIPIAGARRRALLVRLLVAANELVPATRLADDVWGDEASAATVSTLQSHASLLRKALGPGRLVGRDGGYVLTASDDELDVRLFEAEVRRAGEAMRAGDPAAASTLFRTALDRWHGAALADVSGAAWALPEQARLEELRLSSMESWLEVRLELGEHGDVAAVAEAAVTDHPLRERLWACLMLALYRSGRQSEALRSYQRLRARLADELGIEPSAPLVALDEAIVRQKPELEWSRPDAPAGPVPAPPPPTHNLPEQVSSFVGRTHERSAVRRLLTSHRLVTLAGPGGTGKTRLALQTAADMLDQTTDGVWLVELAAVTDDDLVSSTCAAALGIVEQPDNPVLDALTEALRHKNVLVVLDNCEHLLDASSVVVLALLQRCPLVHVLCTSREPLSITGEQIYRVPPLLLPEVAQESRLDELLGVDAVALFCARATSHQPAFTLDADTAAAVCAVCRALDGMPLALELAAARLEALSVEELESGLDERFRLLTRGSRVALPRQQTLRGLVDWSYELLDESERTALCRLSVFSGGWRLADAQKVVMDGELGSLDLLDLVSSLVRKSLVQLETVRGRSRYRMLETIRQYAAEHAMERGEFAAMARAHALVYAAVAESSARQLRGSDAIDGLERLDDEHDNLRAAVATFLAHPDCGPQALGLAVALSRYWETRGFFAEGIAILQAALDATATEAPSLLRARALSCLAVLDLRQGSVTAAHGRSREGMDIARAYDDAAVTSELLRTLVWASAMQGDFAEATVAMADEAVAVAREAGDDYAIGRALMTRGSLLCVSDTSKARTDWEEALEWLRGAGDRIYLANTLGNLAYLDMLNGDAAVARVRIVEAMTSARAIGAVGNLPSLAVNLGLAELLDANVGAATRTLREALVAADRIGDRQGTACAVIGLALCASRVGDGVRAVALHGSAEAMCEENDLPLEPLERKLADDDRRILRETLGDSGYAQAFDAGRRIRGGDRITHALEVSGDPSLSAATSP